MKKIKIFCDPILHLMSLLVIVLCFVWGSLALLILYINADRADFLKGTIIFGVLYLCLISVELIAAKKWSAKVIMDSEGIHLSTIFCKGKKTSYDEYPYFQIGYYMHFTQPRIFVVISKKGLSPKQIVHINNVGISKDTIKISLNKRRAEMLLGVLPEWQKNKLQRALNGELEDVGMDLSKADEPKKIIKKRKNKKGKMYKHKKK